MSTAPSRMHSPWPVRALRETRGLRALYDAGFLLRAYRARMGRWPNPVRPRSFNEHVLRRLILQRDPLFRTLNDKLAMREFVAARLGPGLCVPLLGVHADPGSIAWDDLPPAIVLKPSHASGLVRRIPDHRTIDRAAQEVEARSWLRLCYYEHAREWGYRGLRRWLLVEPLLPVPPGDASPADYRLFVFDGRIAAAFIRRLRLDGRTTKDIFDGTWRRLPVRHEGAPPAGVPPPDAAVQAEMARIARALGAGHEMLRIDTYLVAGRVLVGEITVYPDAGRNPWDPHTFDLWLGAVWRATRRGQAWPAPPA